MPVFWDNIMKLSGFNAEAWINAFRPLPPSLMGVRRDKKMKDLGIFPNDTCTRKGKRIIMDQWSVEKKIPGFKDQLFYYYLAR